MRAVLIVTIATGVLAVGACSKEPAAPAAGGPAPAAEAAAEQPPPPGNVNLAFADMGGAVEELASNYGPGFTGRRLIDGLPDTTWISETGWWIKFQYPLEAVFSFFEREPAWIKAVTIGIAADPASAPKDIEIWTSMTDPYQNFSRVASATLETKPGEQTVEFDPVEAKFVKLRVLSGVAPATLEIAEVKIIEADRRGYMPLYERAPIVKHWKGSPRAAARSRAAWTRLVAAGRAYLEQEARLMFWLPRAVAGSHGPGGRTEA